MRDDDHSPTTTGAGPVGGSSASGRAGGGATAVYRDARDALFSRHGDDAGSPARAAPPPFSFPDVGPTFNWSHDWFDVIARGNGRPALVVVEEDGSRASMTFGALSSRSDQVATWLAGEGVRKGSTVLLMLGNQVALWELMLAIMKLGAVIVPTTTALGPSDLADRIGRSGADFVVCDGSDTSKFDEVPGAYGRVSVGQADGWRNLDDSQFVPASPVEHPRTSPDDALLYYFTSGTTSRPKLVVHTQASYPVGHLSTMYWLGLRPGDVHCNVSSPGWAKHAWSCFFAPWAAEATVYVYNYSRFDPAALLARLREGGVTSLCAPPTVWRMLVTADLSGGPGALRELVAAGEPLNPEVISKVQRAWGITIRDGYGQTETTASVGNPPSSRLKPGSMGRPLPGVPVVLVDLLEGRPLEGPGEGEICIDLARRPVSLMAGYRSDDGSLERMEGGYYRTGDVATVDVEGYITFVGRTDDVFKSSDYKVSPFEVESVLLEHGAVAEAAVVPAPDDLRLSVPKAYVVLAPGAEPSREVALDILAFARSRLAPHHRVRRIEFFDLPKTISGKIRRVELREREEVHRRSHVQPPDEWREEQFPELKS